MASVTGVVVSSGFRRVGQAGRVASGATPPPGAVARNCCCCDERWGITDWPAIKHKELRKARKATPIAIALPILRHLHVAFAVRRSLTSYNRPEANLLSVAPRQHPVRYDAGLREEMIARV